MDTEFILDPVKNNNLIIYLMISSKLNNTFVQTSYHVIVDTSWHVVVDTSWHVVVDTSCMS